MTSAHNQRAEKNLKSAKAHSARVQAALGCLHDPKVRVDAGVGLCLLPKQCLQRRSEKIRYGTSQ